MSKKKIIEVINGPNGEKIEITEIIENKGISLKEAVKRGIVSIDKKEMQKLFSEQELKEMGYEIKEKDDNNTNESKTEN